MKALLAIFLVFAMTSCNTFTERAPNRLRTVQDPDAGVIFPELPPGSLGRQILYGREILVNTSYYFGEKGVIKPLFRSPLSCQSCHLDAGTRLFGNHLLIAYKKFPGYFARTGKSVSLEERITQCIKDHYYQPKDTFPPKEMKAIKDYLHWISKSKIELLDEDKSLFFNFTFPGRKSSAERGKKVYVQHCLRCHGRDGGGEKAPDKLSVLYPALWGTDSYSENSPFKQNYKLAQFIRANMPFGARADNLILSEEEALDVAVYINSKSHPRWGSANTQNYPNLHEKPIDYPIGPYPDPFPANQHQTGPFLPIVEFRTLKKLPNTGY